MAKSVRELYDSWKPLLMAGDGDSDRADQQQDDEALLIEQTNRGPGVDVDGRFPVYKKPRRRGATSWDE